MNNKYKMICCGTISVVLVCFGGYGYINDLNGYGMFLFFSFLVVLFGFSDDD